MSRRIVQAAVVLVLIFAAAQLIRPAHANPPTDASHSIQAQAGTSSELSAVLDRACGDCHSNSTAWPWYTQVAPLSWLWAYGVAEGRRAVNFSEWSSYAPDQQRRLLEAACRDASAGKMPGSIYIALHHEAKLSAKDIETLCEAASQAGGGANR